MIRTYILLSNAGAVVRVVQWDPQFKGLDDSIAAKAGLDVLKQRVELDTLTTSVSGLSASKAAKTWIIPQYRSLFEREIAAIRPGMDERSGLADCLHEALGTTAGDLKRSWKVSAKEPEPEAEKKPDGTMPIPEPWPDLVVYSDVLDAVLAEFLDPHFIVITEAQAIVCAVHTLTTYLTDYLDDWLHFLYVTAGAKDSGKSRLLTLFLHLAYRGDLFANPTAASIYYALQDGISTLLIDEVDKNELHREAILDLINYSSSRTTAWVPRVDLDKKKRVKFPTFCPKVLAGNGSLRDTADSRCIKIRMIRKGPGGPRIRIKKKDAARCAEHRSKLMRIASEIGPSIQEYDIDDLKLPGGIYNREADNWALLFLTVKMVGGHWPIMLQAAYQELCPPRNPDVADEVDEKELGEPLIRDVARIWVEARDQPFYATDALIAKLKTFKDRPWPNMNKGFGLTRQRMKKLLSGFGLGLRSFRGPKAGQKEAPWGYFLKDFVPFFESYARDIWNPPNPPSDDGGSSEPNPPEPPSEGNKEKHSNRGVVVDTSTRTPADQAFKRVDGRVDDLKQNSEIKSEKVVDTDLSPSDLSNKPWTVSTCRRLTPHSSVFSILIPPSTPQAAFCIPFHPERLLFLDIETFCPWDGSYSQPPDKTPVQLLRKQNKGEAHPWAKDPRRCVLRFLTVHDTESTFGSSPLTIDFQENPELPANVLEALANCTIVGHNLDFDITVLRRYGIPVSNSILDTMIASRLLGMGKEKFKVPETAYCDLSDEELDERTSSEMEDPNPVDNDLAAVVRRYLGIRMEKAHTKLGGSDWGRSDLSNDQRLYIPEDVIHLPPLWEVFERELKEASLDHVFRERMEFFPHLNQIKMIGNPIDPLLCEADHKSVAAEKEAVREELCVMFANYRAPIPKSRLKTVKIQVEGGKFKRVPGPTEEEFSPSNRNHVIGALAHHGIYVDNIREATLRKIDSPETRLFLKYFAAKKRLNAIKAIVRSIFPDGRVRAQSWNQLAARTGRNISSEPNLQQVPKNWRTAFRVDPPKIWLKPDLSLIEVVILAVVTGDPGLIDLLRRGEDVYVLVASRLFDVKPIRKEKKEEEGCVTEDLRDQAKPVVLGTNYGLTIWGLCRRFREEFDKELSLEEAQRFFDTFFQMFPGVAEYHTKAAEDALILDCVRTAGGQRRWLSPLLESDQEDNYWPSFERRKKILMNTPIQGGQADVLIRAVNKFMPKLPKEVEVVNLVHDEVDAIVTPETLPIAVEVIGNAFREAFAELYGNTLVPNIKFSKGPGWGELQELSK